MSARQPGPYDCVAYKWLALLTRRQLYFMQLAESDRWNRYYTYAELESELQKTVRLHDQWANIAGISSGRRKRQTLLAHNSRSEIRVRAFGERMPQNGCWIVAPLHPHAVQQAPRRS